jgi:hypothetical protein
VDAPNETNAHTSAAQPVKDVNNAFETREELLPNEKSLERLSNTSSIHVSAGTQEASFTAPSWPFAPEATRPAAHQDAEVSTINKQANLDAVDRAPSEKRSPSGRDDKKHDSSRRSEGSRAKRSNNLENTRERSENLVSAAAKMAKVLQDDEELKGSRKSPDKCEPGSKRDEDTSKRSSRGEKPKTRRKHSCYFSNLFFSLFSLLIGVKKDTYSLVDRGRK